MEPNPNGSLRALKTTALGGVFFLLPIVVVGIVLTYIYRMVATIHERLEPWIPFHSTTGIALGTDAKLVGQFSVSSGRIV